MSQTGSIPNSSTRALRELIDTARMDFIFLTLSKTLRENPFILDHVFGYAGLLQVVSSH